MAYIYVIRSSEKGLTASLHCFGARGGKDGIASSGEPRAAGVPITWDACKKNRITAVTKKELA